ncbi:transposase [Escherichia coli]|nr:transposase [Escherichia coli]
MDSARALIARGWGVSLVSRCLRVSRAQLHVILRRTDDWKDGRRSRHSDDTDVLLRIHHVIGKLPTYGYREALHWAVTTGGFDSETVQDVMLGAVERRFGNELPASPVEWLTDNGSCYRANETRQFARILGLEPKNTAVRSPESNGIAESFVKTIKRDYISIMPKPDGLTAAKNLAEAFEHYNEWHPHSALGYRSPREYLRQQASNGLSDNRCLEI